MQQLYKNIYYTLYCTHTDIHTFFKDLENLTVYGSAVMKQALYLKINVNISCDSYYA